jgi:hypothetical protein
MEGIWREKMNIWKKCIYRHCGIIFEYDEKKCPACAHGDAQLMIEFSGELIESHAMRTRIWMRSHSKIFKY